MVFSKQIFTKLTEVICAFEFANCTLATGPSKTFLLREFEKSNQYSVTKTEMASLAKWLSVRYELSGCGFESSCSYWNWTLLLIYQNFKH